MRGGPVCSVPEFKEKKMIRDEMFALHFGKNEFVKLQSGKSISEKKRRKNQCTGCFPG